MSKALEPYKEKPVLGPSRKYLTPLLNRIADVAGVEAAIYIGTRKASRIIYIPAKVKKTHWLSQALGFEKAQALCTEMGPQHISIPPALAGQRKRTHDAIIALTEMSWTVDEIASSLGVARSTVYDNRGRAQMPEPAQTDLFSLPKK